MSDLIEITGLWENKTKDGETFYAGSFGGAKVLIFKNKFKKNDSQPDLRMYVAPREKKPRDEQVEDAGVEAAEEDRNEAYPF